MANSTERPAKRTFFLQWFLIVGILLVLFVGSLTFAPEPVTTPKLETKGMIQALTMAYTAYISDNGTFPKNMDNQMFERMLSGDNPEKKPYMYFKPNQKTPSGELVDAWGTPFRISYSSNSDVTIISAGPDKIFGTVDDITNQ